MTISSSHTETVQIWFNENAAPYVISKPLHGSQKTISHDETGLIIQLEIIPNFELETLILSFGERAKVISPESFREVIMKRVKGMRELYS